MSSIKPIYWNQGLFLKPHHFQYLQAYQQQDNLTMQENSEPYFWGVSKLEIDRKELINKNILIRNLELVFMDGTVVKIPQNAVVTSRSFDGIDLVDELKVFVGIKSFKEDGVNVSELNSYENIENVETRFICKKDAQSVSNLYHSDEKADIQFMDYCVKIFFEDEIENLNAYQVMPIAKIKEQGEQVLLSNKYTPPSLNIEVDTKFYEIIKIIQKDISSHALQLEEYKLPTDSSSSEPHYQKYVMALQALVSFIPQVNHLIKTPHIHPWYYYGVFAQLIGILSTFSTRVNYLGKLANGNYLIQEYNHQNLYECFHEMQLLISELLDAIIIGPDYILPFVKDETLFSLDCPVLIFNAKYRYFLVVKSATRAEEFKADFINFAKIATALELDNIVQRSLIGLPFELYNMSIQGLPQRENSLYYELLTDDAHWGSIQQTQNISIEFDDAEDDISIELIVVKK